MKKTLKLSLIFLTTALLHSNMSMAAFPIKKEAVKTESNANSIISTAIENPQLHQEVKLQKQESINAVEQKASSSTIPQGLYIVLAIFFLGWLAIGINDDWAGYDWLISLLLYIILWLPGFIFTLIKMSKYY